MFLGSTLRAAQTVTLAWQPSPSTNVAGYLVHYGRASGRYGARLDAGTNTTATVAGLKPGATCFFVVTAYDAHHVESPPSNEVSYRVPGVVLGVIQLVGGTGPKDPLCVRTPVARRGVYEIQASVDLRSWFTAWYLIGTSNHWVELTVPQVNIGFGGFSLSALLQPLQLTAEFFRVVIHSLRWPSRRPTVWHGFCLSNPVPG